MVFSLLQYKYWHGDVLSVFDFGRKLKLYNSSKDLWNIDDKKRNSIAIVPQINPGTQHGGYRHALYKPDSRINN